MKHKVNSFVTKKKHSLTCFRRKALEKSRAFIINYLYQKNNHYSYFNAFTGSEFATR